jgi:3',5'-cyclic AMP phosphodiesterase CpdA
LLGACNARHDKTPSLPEIEFAVYTILHISDLHRSTSYPFGNEEIVSALRADIARAARETTPIAAPDAIIVSGDLVQGLRLGSKDYPDGLREQYQVALDL